MKKNEIDWINMAKAISIFLVYLFHTEFYMQLDFPNIKCFYTPFFTHVFFFISGYLIFRRQLSTKIISLKLYNWFFMCEKGNGKNILLDIVFKIAIPTVLFTSLLFFPKTIIRGQGFEFSMFLHDTILGGSIWFTSALAVSELLLFFMLLPRYRSYWWYGIFSVILALIGVYFAKNANGLYGISDVPWFWKGGFIATLFLVFGGIYQKYEDRVDAFFKK